MTILTRCPRAAAQLVDHLEIEVAAVPHVMLTDVDLATGDLIPWLDNGQRFIVTIVESPDDVG